MDPVIERGRLGKIDIDVALANGLRGNDDSYGITGIDDEAARSNWKRQSALDLCQLFWRISSHIQRKITPLSRRHGKVLQYPGIDVGQVFHRQLLIVPLEKLERPFLNNALDRCRWLFTFLDRAPVDPPFGFLKGLVFLVCHKIPLSGLYDAASLDCFLVPAIGDKPYGAGLWSSKFN